MNLDGTPIPWGALSGIASEIRVGYDHNMMYTVEDSFYATSRFFTMDVSSMPAVKSFSSLFRIFLL